MRWLSFYNETFINTVGNLQNTKTVKKLYRLLKVPNFISGSASWIKSVCKIFLINSNCLYGVRLWSCCCCCCRWRDTFVSKGAPDLKLGQSPLPSQQVLLLIAGIIHGRPVLDVSLTPLPPESTPGNVGHGRRNLFCLFWTGFLGLHYTRVKACLQGFAILDSKVARPL